MGWLLTWSAWPNSAICAIEPGQVSTGNRALTKHSGISYFACHHLIEGNNSVLSVYMMCNVYINYILYIVCADHKVANYNVKSSFQRSQTNNKRRHWYHSAECCVLWFPHCGFHRTKQHINIVLELLQPQTWFQRLNMRAPCSNLLSWKSNI